MFTCASVLDVWYAIAVEGRATMQKITVHLKDKKIAFIQREDVNELGSKVLTYFRKIMLEEIGDLLPKSFRFEILSVPVPSLEEKRLKLNSCFQNETITIRTLLFKVSKVKLPQLLQLRQRRLALVELSGE